jgi:hypothetical protein
LFFCMFVCICFFFLNIIYILNTYLHGGGGGGGPPERKLIIKRQNK